MNGVRGRTVRLFLAEGTASGFTTAEIINWTGSVLTCPRSGLAAFLKREESQRTGVYFLSGPDPKDPDTLQIYIGESDNVGKRLLQHAKDEKKDFWEDTCVITSKDQNITKAHACYLETRLIKIANKSGTVRVVNGTDPSVVSLPEADRSDMDFFIDQLRLILPVLGFGFLRQYRPAKKTITEAPDALSEAEAAPIFELIQGKLGVKAEAREIDGELVVLQGSTAVAEWRREGDYTYVKLHTRLVESGKLGPEEAGLRFFTEDVPFRSPSAASAVILGRSDNGRRSWTVSGSSTSYGDWQSQQLAKTASGTLADENDEPED